MAIPPLPEKKYFKIGEVADLVGVEPHVLRYWETQFSQLRPHKARSGHRLYRRREVETLLVIRELLHVQRFTIAGARQALRQPGGASSLLPRFFDTPAASSAPTLVPGEDDLDDGEGDPGDGEHGDALVDGDDGATDIRAAALSAEASSSALPALAEVEVEALAGEDLARALERQTLEDRTGGLVEVEVEGVEVPPAIRAPRAARPLGGGALATGLSAHDGARGKQQRLMLEAAMGDARAVLAILDREDLRALPFTR